MQGDHRVINSDETLKLAIADLEAQYEQHRYLRVKVETGKQRTDTQNRALHVYFRLLADALNDSGQDMRKVLKQEIAIPWTEHSVKNHLWRPVQEAMTGKESTAKAEKQEYSEVYEALNRHLGERTGVYVPWPQQ